MSGFPGEVHVDQTDIYQLREVEVKTLNETTGDPGDENPEGEPDPSDEPTPADEE